ncbi:MAG: DUF1804 family protein [Hyphomicrobiales bacterium]|nr:DUF1804 family protein [Hyphomicrobiales bacterium]
MARDAAKQRDLRKAYVVDGLTLPAAAITAGVPEGTARRWKREAADDGDDWDRARAAATMAGSGRDAILTDAVEGFVIQFKMSIDKVTDDADLAPAQRVQLLASLADAFNKVVAAAGRVSPKISELGVALDVLKRFGDFVAKNHPDAGPALLEALESFGDTLAEVYK